MNQAVDNLAELAVTKIRTLDSSPARVFVSAMLAGVYVGFGIVLIFSIGAPLQAAGSPAVRLAMGASFGVALTLVIFAGSELFTGNNMIMTIGCLRRRIGWGQMMRAWTVCYAGNLAGSLALAALMAMSGLSRGAVGEFVTATAAAKMSAPAAELFARGVLCNMLVCLAIWTASRTKSDAAKLGLIFWCLFAFIGSGFEHSIANMTLLGWSLLIPHGPAVSWAGLAANLIPVTAGNILGGAFFVGAAYAYIGSSKKAEAKAAPQQSPDHPCAAGCIENP
ncbi:MAG: formate/nitrite transporter family protein [Planctomycetaceae bacterium]|nr:formate/nitrite transporter family protein [Planctomycetaceae bacterium]